MFMCVLSLLVLLDGTIPMEVSTKCTILYSYSNKIDGSDATEILHVYQGGMINIGL